MLMDRRNPYWIGMYQSDNSQYVWTDNSDVTYTNWAKGEPNGGIAGLEQWGGDF